MNIFCQGDSRLENVGVSAMPFYLNLPQTHPHFSAAQIQWISRLVIYSWMWFSMETGRYLCTVKYIFVDCLCISENYCIPCAKGIRVNRYLNYFRILTDIHVFHCIRSSNDKRNWNDKSDVSHFESGKCATTGRQHHLHRQHTEAVLPHKYWEHRVSHPSGRGLSCARDRYKIQNTILICSIILYYEVIDYSLLLCSWCVWGVCSKSPWEAVAGLKAEVHKLTPASILS